jgi:FkbM family methyltransferase
MPAELEPYGQPPKSSAHHLPSIGQPSAQQPAPGTRHQKPEIETAEVLNAFLLNCKNCRFVDIGCNMGLFALQAAALGANVQCYEPMPFYVEAIRLAAAHARLASGQRFDVHHRAVVPKPAPNRSFLSLTDTYRPCGVAVKDQRHMGRNLVEAVAIGSIVDGRTIALLKVDIDSIEGALLHEVIELSAANRTDVQSILIEIGDNANTDYVGVAMAKAARGEQARTEAKSLRGGSVQDVWRLVHELGYDAYRVNIHTLREVFSWEGLNANTQMAPPPEGLRAQFGLRGMRKLERLSRALPIDNYAALFGWGQSYLFTKVRLGNYATHHTLNLEQVRLPAELEAARRGRTKIEMLNEHFD